MPVSSRYILNHGPMLGTLGRTLVQALRHKNGNRKASPAGPLQTPGPELTRTVAPLPRGLINAYIRHLGGDVRGYRGEVPPHLFPQWGMPLAARVIEPLPYPMIRVVNGGCRMSIRAPLPSGRPLQARAHLVDVDDNGRRAVIQTQVATGTPEIPDALICTIYAVVRLARGSEPSTKRSLTTIVPTCAREVAYWNIPPDAGLDFAKLTGDFNPIHWIRRYAKASGYARTILHGFAMLARICEGLNRSVFSGDNHRLRTIDVKFVRPLLLPAAVGLYVSGDEVFLGDERGCPSYVVGRFETGESQ